MNDYWVYVADNDGTLLLGVKSDGTVEYGVNYTPARARLTFESHFRSIRDRRVIAHDEPPAIEGTEIAVITKIEPRDQ